MFKIRSTAGAGSCVFGLPWEMTEQGQEEAFVSHGHKSTAPFTLSRLLDGSDCGLHCGSNRLLESSKLCLLAFRVRFALRSCSSMVLKQQGLQT